MTIALWVLQVSLGALLLFAGINKAFRPLDVLVTALGWKWVAETPPALVRVIGVVEMLGVVGLIVPPLVGIAPGLVAWAALGLAVLMVLAAGLHGARREFGQVGFNLVVLVLALVVAYRRWQVAPF